MVASEVKALANQPPRRRRKFPRRSMASRTRPEKPSTAIQTIERDHRRDRRDCGAIASAVDEQGAATREIAGNVQQAAKGTRDVMTNFSA